jgi:probable HAF family extracellular repeat protein
MTKRRWLIVIGAFSAVLTIALWLRSPRLYRVTLLPSIGKSVMLATAINDQGQVIGVSRLNGIERLFLWDRRRGMRDLGYPGAGPLDINNRGQIAGTHRDPNGVEQAFLWDPNSGMHMLGTLGGTGSQAHGINNHGWIVGVYYRSEHNPHVFIWDQTRGMRDLGLGDWWFGVGWGLNDANQTVASNMEGEFIVRMDEQGVVQTRDRLPAGGLSRMNNRGQMAGTAKGKHQKTAVVRWDPNSGLRTLSCDAYATSVSAINDAGQVLFSQVRDAPVHVEGTILLAARQKCFLWDPERGEIGLGRYVSLGRGKVLSLKDINNQGCIVGTIYCEKTGTGRVVLLEPIPERWGQR